MTRTTFFCKLMLLIDFDYFSCLLIKKVSCEENGFVNAWLGGFYVEWNLFGFNLITDDYFSPFFLFLGKS